MNTITPISRALADYTALRLIVPRMQGFTTSTVMDELSHVFHEADPTWPDLRFDSRAALRRELLTGLALEFGTVLPCVRVPGIQHPRFALGRPAEPLRWLAKFYPPTELVVLLAEPGASTPESEQLVETLNRLRRDQAVLNRLRLARTAEEMLMLLGLFPMVGTDELAKVQAQQLQRVSDYAASRYTRGQTRRG